MFGIASLFRVATPRVRPSLQSRFGRRLLVERLEERLALAIAVSTNLTNDVVFLGDTANNAVTLQVNALGYLQHNVPLSGNLTSNIDLDSATAGVQAKLVADIHSLSFDGAAGADTLTFNGTINHDYASAVLIDIDAETVNINQNVSVGAGDFDSQGTAAFATLAGKSLTASGEIRLSHGGTLTIRGPLSANAIELTSGATTASAIAGSNATLSAGTGGIVLDAGAGGIQFASTTMNSSGSISLLSGNAVVVLIANTGGNFTSTGSGSFAMSTDPSSSISAAGTVAINHTGTITLRNDVTAAAIQVVGGSSLASAITATAADAVLTATQANLVLTATNGGINAAGGTLIASDGNIQLTAATTTSVHVIQAADAFTSTGGGTFDMTTSVLAEITATGPVTIDHGGSVNIRNAVTGSTVELHSQATSVSAILGTSSNAAVLATVGNIVLDAPQGGINFSLSDLTAAADITLSAGTAITVKTVNAGDDFTSLGATTFNTASSGSQITAVGDVTVNHIGTVTFRGPITGKSISLTSAATTAAAINGINTSATLLSTSGDVVLQAAGGVTLSGAVTVNGAPAAGPAVPLSWGAVTDLPNGVLGYDQLFAGYGATNPLAINGAETIYTNPGGGGFDVGVRLISPNTALSGNTGSFGGAVTAGPLSTPHVYFNPWSGSNNTFYLKVSFYATGTTTPVDVVGFETAFEDVERGRDTREWLMGPQYTTSGGSVVNLDFSPASGFVFPTVAPDGSASWAVKSVELLTTVYGETVYRAVPWYGVESGTQANKNVLLDLSSTPLSSFRIGTSKTSNGGSWLMSGLGTIQIAASTPAGQFISTGTTFAANANIVVNGAGSVTLNHSGAMNIYARLEAASYAINGTSAASDLTIRSTGTLVFLVDVSSPPLTPRLTVTGGGDLQFLSGSKVEVYAYGGSSLPGMYTLATVSGGTITGGGIFTKVKTGPALAAIDDFFTSGANLQLDLV